MTFAAALFNFLVIIPAAVLCFLPMKHQLRYPAKCLFLTIGLIFAVIIPLAAWLTYRFSLSANTLLIPIILIMFLGYRLCLSAHLSYTLAVYAVVCALMSILANFASCFEARFYPDSGAEVLHLTGSLFHFAISMAALAVLAFPFLHFGTRLIDSLHLNGIWYSTCLMSFVIFVSNLTLQIRHYQILYVGSLFITYLFILFMLLAMWTFMIILFYHTVASLLHAESLKSRNHLLEMQESQFIKQQKFLRILKKPGMTSVR